ncbi:hypothetical protein COJ46_15430 [Bacillus sp. AFS077874]|uniref:hypothetical protein n=1 Tax=unclassified Bacillus (in: firmicutes) TaxID=185979 RepID=UPI000BEE5D6D|nr:MULTISPECIES: hypothetical protein [unclassified Bacillus (in: firmicutes)]PEC49667.1 hypothetical protein CON00_07290 [Bacillus sp. AFS096315]PFM79658.1 hypothetical protein COJ46_15430 [Bacillus sp. AFS077874]
MTRKTWLFIFLCCCILFISLHATPSVAIRTKLFFTFHPKSALTSKISLQARENKGYQPYLHNHHAKAYQISNPPSSMQVNDFIVYQKGFIFSAKYLDNEMAKIKNW